MANQKSQNWVGVGGGGGGQIPQSVPKPKETVPGVMLPKRS